MTATLDPVTVPIPEMDTEAAPEMLQDRVLLWPEVIFVGEAVKLTIVGGAGALTATVTVAVTLPAAFVAVSV